MQYCFLSPGGLGLGSNALNPGDNQTARTTFTVRTIECVSCTPAFRRHLERVKGVKSVRALVMLNKIEVEFDADVVSKEEIKNKILEVGSKSGFSGKIVFQE